MIRPNDRSIAPVYLKTSETRFQFIANRPGKPHFRHCNIEGRHSQGSLGRVLACWLALLTPAAWADSIYIYTGNGGVIYLGNAPAGRNHQFRFSPRPPRAETPRATALSAPRYGEIIKHAARANGLEGALLDAVISVESRYNPRATSKKGARGLMQLTPETAIRYGVVDAYDPVQNVHGGAKYLHDLLVMFRGDVSLALAAYNAGEASVTRHGNHIPPFRETTAYVSRVMACYREYLASRTY